MTDGRWRCPRPREGAEDAREGSGHCGCCAIAGVYKVGWERRSSAVTAPGLLSLSGAANAIYWTPPRPTSSSPSLQATPPPTPHFPYTSSARFSNPLTISPLTFSHTALTAAAWNGEANA